ncbi:MAG TPA: hypothetical protein VFC74_10340 [Oscillospiraceae bacterium]|nr:hypothetical protein [Oscillospiraceae bacterium]
MNRKMLAAVSAISTEHQVILRGYVQLSGGVHGFLFGHYCKNTLFYKDLFKVTRDVFRVNRLAKQNLRQIKKLLKKYGYRRIWAKGVFSIYGDLRPLAVAAGLGQWENGLVANAKYGSDFLISGIFFK